MTTATRRRLAVVAAAGALGVGLLPATTHAVPAPVADATPVAQQLRPAVAGVSTGTYRVPTSGRTVSYLTMSQPTLSFRFVPGTTDPGGYDSRLDGPATYRKRMVAAFNGGFLLGAGTGGYALRGRVYRALVPGYASLVINRSTGRLDVLTWRSGMQVSKYAVVRQNLPPLVYGGKNKTATRGNGCDSWGAVGTQFRHCPGERSAVGITPAGTVVYVYGFRVYADDLARALIHLGAQRGMVMERNQAWPRAYTYSGSRARILDPNMSPVEGAYQNGYKRDFVVALR
jgi:hypothetical protein